MARWAKLKSPLHLASTAGLRNVLVLLVLLCSAAANAAPAEPRVEVLASGLAHPWSLALLPDGSLLITERSGQLRVFKDGALLPTPVAGVPAVYVQAQAGLFDVVLDPDFANNRWLYLAYAQGSRGANATRVARAKFDGATLTALEVLLDVVPAKNTPVHYGGRLLFLPDGTLLVTTGDGFTLREEAQRLDNLLGKTLRIHADGSIPADNPFVGRADARPEIYTYGHRNPQGLALDAASGQVYLHEHGPRGGDELHLLQPGRNYGWPVITYGVDYSGARISPYTSMTGMEQPLLYWVPSIAPSGLAIYQGELFADWRGKALIGALAGQALHLVQLDGVVQDLGAMLRARGQRIRDVREGPDGALYLLTDAPDGQLLRLIPAVAER